MKLFAMLAAGMLALASTTAAAVPNPLVTGPIASPATPGDSSHDYTFFTTNHPLAVHGYVEEEYFIEGTANRYNTPNLATGSIVSSGNPYKTRIVVRRPVNRARFNGVVLVEWINVTNGFDADNLWFFGWEHILRSGYAWVGVSAQLTGVNALKTWNPTRYGSLDVTANGTVPTDVLSYDIFAQAGQAVAHPMGVDVLKGLKPKMIIATGESQSAQRLTTYINSVMPLDNVYDAAFLLSTFGQQIRTDVVVPTFKVLFEWDTQTGEAALRQPDSSMYRSWEVAGTAHVDYHLRLSREPLELRDMLTSSEATLAPTCTIQTIGSHVPNHYVVAAAIDHLVRWTRTGQEPPASPKMMIESFGTGSSAKIARDGFNLAQGGIRLSQIEVPTAQNVGENTGGGACPRWGYHTPFDIETLNALYFSKRDYVGLVVQVTRENYRRGYILKQDAQTTIREAQELDIGRGTRVPFDWDNDPDFADN